MPPGPPPPAAACPVPPPLPPPSPRPPPPAGLTATRLPEPADPAASPEAARPGELAPAPAPADSPPAAIPVRPLVRPPPRSATPVAPPLPRPAAIPIGEAPSSPSPPSMPPIDRAPPASAEPGDADRPDRLPPDAAADGASGPPPVLAATVAACPDDAATAAPSERAPAFTVDDRAGERLPVAPLAVDGLVERDRETLTDGAPTDAMAMVAWGAPLVAGVAGRLAEADACAGRRGLSWARGDACWVGAAADVAAGAIVSARAAEPPAAAVAVRRARAFDRGASGASEVGRAARLEAVGARAVSFSRSATSRGRHRAAMGPESPRSRGCAVAGAASAASVVSVAAAAAAMSADAGASMGATSATRSIASAGWLAACWSSGRECSSSGCDGVTAGSGSGGTSRLSATLRSAGRWRDSVGRGASVGTGSVSGRSCAGRSAVAERDTWSRKSAAFFRFAGSSASESAGRSTARSSRDTESPPKKIIWMAKLAAAARASRRR